jgi:hypothetical protein
MQLVVLLIDTRSQLRICRITFGILSSAGYCSERATPLWTKCPDHDRSCSPPAITANCAAVFPAYCAIYPRKFMVADVCFPDEMYFDFDFE